MVDSETRSASKRLQLAGSLALCLGIAVFVPAAMAHAQQNEQTAAARSDSEIQSDVAYALTTSAALKGQRITAATIEGDVTLSGNVSDAASKELAESMVARVNGVRSVTNNLTVGSVAPDEPAQQPQDQQGQYPAEQAPPPPDQNAQQAPPPDENAQQAHPYMGEDPGEDPQQRTQPDDRANNYYPPPPPQDRRQPQDRRDYGRNDYPEQPSGPVIIPAGTLLRVRSSETLDTRKLQPGAMFEVTAASDIYVGSTLAIPRGATMEGVVVDAKTPTGLKGSSSIALQLNSLNLGGRSYTLKSDIWSTQGPGKGAYSAENTVGGAAIGAIIGGIAGRGTGAAIGAAAGGATGAAASAASSGPRLIIPAEAVVNFHLAEPVTVVPVSYREAERLASADRARRPRLQQRAMYPYPPPPPPYYYYPYGYPYRRGYYYGW